MNGRYYMFISYVKGEGYKVVKEYCSNDVNEVYETIQGLTKESVNGMIIELGQLYTPIYNGMEIGLLW